MDYEPTQADIEDLEAAQAYQQSMDEQRELLDEAERREEILWRAMNTLKDAIALCGRSAVVAELSRVGVV